MNLGLHRGAVLDLAVERIFSGDVRLRRHCPALAEAMQEGYHCLDPHLQMGDMGQPNTFLSPLQMGLSGREGAVFRALRSTRMNSGVRIIRAIHITVLKRGDSEHHTHQNMHVVVRSETTPLHFAESRLIRQPLKVPS